MPYPNFFVPGATRCGTNTVAAHLNQHPDILMAEPKEPDLFGKHFGDAIARESCFVGRTTESLLGDATAHYMGSPGVAARIAGTVPDAKFVVCLREPVERTISHYEYRLGHGNELRSFDDLLRAGLSADVIRHSAYHRNLAPFLERFNLDHFHFVDLVDLAAAPQEVMDRIFEFLGVTPARIDPTQSNAAPPVRRTVLIRWMARAQQQGLGRVIPRGTKSALRRTARRITRSGRPGTRLELTRHQRTLLWELLEPDVDALEQATGFDCSRWRRTQVLGMAR